MTNTKMTTKDLDRPVTVSDMLTLFSNNNVILFKAMDEKIAKNNEVLIPLMGKMMDEKIAKNNEVLIPLMGKMMDEKIAKNNVILINLIDEKIAKNNVVLISLIDKKIKDNNEYIFEHFNNQTDRLLSLFQGVVRINKHGYFHTEVI